MTTVYGTKMFAALRAIAQMHSDTSALLVDSDKYVGKGRPSVFDSIATRDLTYHYKADCWMAEGVYRYYDAGANAVDGITVAFFRKELLSDRRTEFEPLLIVGRIQYTASADADAVPRSAKKMPCEPWDLWYLYFKCGQVGELGKALSREFPDRDRIAWARLIAVPLFSVNRIETVVTLLEQAVATSTTCGL